MMIQPTENPNIPDNLTAQIEAVRNQITLGESEVSRLKGLTQSLKQEINTITIQKADLEEQVKTLTVKADELGNLVLTRANELTALTKEKSDIETSIVEQTKAFGLKSEELSQRESNISAQEQDLKSKQEIHEQNISTFQKEKEAHDIKVNKLIEALK